MHIGPAERVDGLVRVPHRDELTAVTRQRVQQGFLGRVGVLILVDQHHVVGLALAVPGRRPAQQRCGDPDDLRVVVGRDRGQVEARGVAVQETAPGHPVVPAERAAQPGQAPAVQPALGRAEQEIAQLGGEAPGAQGGPEPVRPAMQDSRWPAARRLGARCLRPEHAPDLQQLLRAGQQGRRDVAGQHELPADQGVGVAVEGQRQRLAGRPPQPGGDPFPQLLRGLTAEGQDQHPFRVDPALGDPLHHRLDDGRGLAGTGSGQHEQRAARVRHHGPLGGVQARRIGWRRGPAQQPVGVRVMVHRPAFQQRAPTSAVRFTGCRGDLYGDGRNDRVNPRLATFPAGPPPGPGYVPSRLAARARLRSLAGGLPGPGYVPSPAQRARRMSTREGGPCGDGRSGVPSAR